VGLLLATATASAVVPRVAAANHLGEVTVTATWSPARQLAVVTLRPDRPGFHVYSVDPAGRSAGLGIPTRVLLADPARSAGDMSADKPTVLLHYVALGIDLPVYPDGAVTITVPVHGGTGPPVLLVTYAACSDSLCLPPIHDARVVPVVVS